MLENELQEWYVPEASIIKKYTADLVYRWKIKQAASPGIKKARLETIRSTSAPVVKEVDDICFFSLFLSAFPPLHYDLYFNIPKHYISMY